MSVISNIINADTWLEDRAREQTATERIRTPRYAGRITVRS